MLFVGCWLVAVAVGAGAVVVVVVVVVCCGCGCVVVVGMRTTTVARWWMVAVTIRPSVIHLVGGSGPAKSKL
jgi:hypothetical protein